MSEIVIYHNPKCSKSRQTLALIQGKGVEPEIRDYLNVPPTTDELHDISKKLGLRPKDFIRKKEADFKALNLDLEDDAAIYDAINKCPKILERPIVIRGNHAVLGRPPENVEDLF